MKGQRLRTLVILLTLAIATILSTGLAGAALPAASVGPQQASGPAGWWATVQEGIRRSEYHVTWQEQTYLHGLTAGYQAPNRAQDLRTYFTAEGIRVIPRGETEPSWELAMALADYGDGQDVQVTANRVEYHYPSAGQRINAWYINDEAGLEQGFTIATPRIPASDFEIGHGEAVALGMLAAARISSKLGILDKNELIRLKSVISRAGLPTEIPSFDLEGLIKAIKHDKKILQGKLRFTLPRSIGDVFITDEVSPSLIEQALVDSNDKT